MGNALSTVLFLVGFVTIAAIVYWQMKKSDDSASGNSGGTGGQGPDDTN